ncbi:YopX family protein [Macrococcoides caseolyticum]|uniref:YopX family protein n=1 Tax=Macrococcoides caseolyticum TaxID=69966 RepID=UPI0018E1AB12|nr:YopX family protein [Macrococcus caseolyticus]QQB06154.1 hypothetical protein I6H62_03035 [Macrococcus caseolyticus]
MIPKFRVWDEQLEQIWLLSTINFDNNDITYGTEYDEYEVSLDDDSVILMQSTGLHDVNAKEIFEGDIVKVSQDDDYFISFVKNMIEFDYPGFDVPFPDDWNYECNVLSHLMNTDQKIEVIGNIHEHPELLNQPNE